MKKLLTADDLAEILQLTRRAVHMMVQRGDIPRPIKIGRAARWPADEIEAILSRKEKN